MIKRLAVFALLASACGPTSFEPFCEQSAAAGCRQLFRCNPDSAKTAFGDVAGCVSRLEQQSSCAKFADTMCTLDGAKTAKCLADIENASCSTQPGDLPSSCSELTCGGGSGVRCRSTSSSGGTNGCDFTLSNCSDSNSYGISCSAGTCSCLKNGATERSFSGTCASDSDAARVQLKDECGHEVN